MFARYALLVLALGIAVGGGAYALSAVPDRAGVFHGCVNKKTKVLRVVDSASQCRKTVRRGKHKQPGETAIAWNQKGAPGTNGTNGANGANGASKVVTRVADFTSNASGDSGDQRASCNAGERATGGGISWTQSPGSGDTIRSSNPLLSPEGFPANGDVPTAWEGDIHTSDGMGKTGRIWVICVSP
jgi:hypothetical protein